MSFWVKYECWYRVYGFLVLKLYTVVLEYCWYGYTALYDVFYILIKRMEISLINIIFNEINNIFLVCFYTRWGATLKQSARNGSKQPSPNKF